MVFLSKCFPQKFKDCPVVKEKSLKPKISPCIAHVIEKYLPQMKIVAFNFLTMVSYPLIEIGQLFRRPIY